MTARKGQTSGVGLPRKSSDRGEGDDAHDKSDRGRRLDVGRPRDEEVPERVQEGRAECEGKCRGGHLRLQSNQATAIGARSSGHGQPRRLFRPIPVRRGAGLAQLRPPGDRRRHRRQRGRRARRASRARGSARRCRRLRWSHVELLVEAHPRRAALPQARGRSARTRGSSRAASTHEDRRASSGAPDPVPAASCTSTARTGRRSSRVGSSCTRRSPGLGSTGS